MSLEFRNAPAFPPDRLAVAPTGALGDSFLRTLIASSTVAMTSGTLRGHFLWLPAGLPLTAINVRAGNTGSTGLTHSYAALYDAAGNLVIQSNDDTSEWVTNTDRAFTLTTPYTIPTSGLWGVALVEIAATAVANLLGVATINNAAGGWFPRTGANYDTGLTTGVAPATLGAAAQISGTPYLWFT